MSRATFHVAFLVFFVLNLGCSTPSAPEPVIPLQSPPLSDVPPQVRPVLAAALAFEDEGVRVSPSSDAGGEFFYEPRFRLRETGGMSGATIQNLLVIAPTNGAEAGSECWLDPLRVPPGGALDTFYTDAGWNWLGYCGPATGGTNATPRLYVLVTFTDDHGVTGRVSTMMTPR